MTHDERKALREKHWPHLWHEMEICDSCDREFPCDAVKLLDYLDVVEPMLNSNSENVNEINWPAGK